MSPRIAAPPDIAIPLDRFRSFYHALWTDLDGRRSVGDEKKREFLMWIEGVTDMSAEDLSDRLGAVFEDLFDEIESELGPVTTGNLDPRHVHLFLLKP